MSGDTLTFAPMAVFVLAALFATLAAVKRQVWLGWFRRMRAASGVRTD